MSDCSLSLDTISCLTFCKPLMIHAEIISYWSFILPDILVTVDLALSCT